MALTIPPKPSSFSPVLPPPGYRVKLLPFNNRRRLMTPRLQLAHTNGAETEGSIESSYNWAMRNTWPGYIYGSPAGEDYKTIPHFQVDRDGDAAMLLELNRIGIAAARANPFTISYETADRGWRTDAYPTGSAFTEPQLQMMANGFAYCSALFKIPLVYPATWDGAGSACHTEPFGYPVWTNSFGKPCPGIIKKQQVRDIILPHARRILAAWSGAPPPPPPPPTGVPIVMRYGGTTAGGWTGYYSMDNGRTKIALGSMADAQHMTVTLKGLDAKTRKRPADPWGWSDVYHTTSMTTLNQYLCSLCSAPTPPPTSNHGLYTVVAGDSWWKISQMFGVSVSALKSANNTTSDTLSIGQVVKIPGLSTYTVVSGDSWWSIAADHETTVAKLVSINPPATATTIIHPGQKINIP